MNASPRRILFFDHTALLGGGEIALLNLVRELDPRRYTPVVVLGSAGPLADRLIQAGVETHVLPLPPSILHTRKDAIGFASLARVKDILRVVRYADRLTRFIRAGGFDLVHTNSLKADLIGGLAGRMAGAAVLWHVRDRIARDYLPRTVVACFRLLSRIVPHYVIANSAATLETLPRRLDRSASAIPSGLRLSKHDMKRVVHDGLAASGHGPCAERATTRCVGLVGRISPWKGQGVFLRAAAIVKQGHPDVRFQIIGSALFSESAYEAEIRALATSLGLNGQVEFTGFRDDVPALIDGLEILVHASTTPEPFGQVVIEGMVAAKPVVATAGGGVLEIVTDGVTGLLVPMNDAPAMAAAIEKLLGDPQAAQAMGRRARQHVLDHFTIQQTARKIERVYGQVLGRVP